MKRKKIIIGLTTIIAITLVTTGCGKEIPVKNGSKVAVSIKDNKFTATEYYSAIKKDNISKLIDMLDRSFLEKEYKKTTEETDEIDQQVEQIKSSYANGDEDTYNNVLKQYFGVDSEAELKDKLSLEYKRKKAVEDYILDNISDSEIKNYYNDNINGEVKASHILITPDVKSDASEQEKEKAEEKAKKEAKNIIKKLDEGKKFEDLAKKYSADKSNASNGGNLGFFDLNDMVEEFSNAVKELKVDEYTKEPVKTEFGYHIILKTGEKKKPALKKVKKDIKEKIKDQKMEESNATYYKALMAIRENHKIKWNDTVLKKAYNEYMNDLIDSANKAAEQNSQS